MKALLLPLLSGLLSFASCEPTPPASSCRALSSPAPVLILTIPKLGYVCTVHQGGQSIIDQGAVASIQWTDFYGPSGPPEAYMWPYLHSQPGWAGLIWLAAHQSSHGSAFARITELVNGDTVTVARTSDGASWTYRVVGMAYVNEVMPDPASTIFRGSLYERRMILQTSAGGSYRWLIYLDAL